MPIIEVDHVTKEFRLGQLRSLKQTLLDGVARLRGQVIHAAPFKALDDVSFGVEQGEVVGIIGHNGAGKSTLLKMLAGISAPTKGRIVVGGKVAPLIEVGAGLVPDLTGRENIFLNASILGMRRAEIARRLDEIVAFAELEEFIDTPIKRYSSGMKVRLGFSIATIIDAEILIVDEVLSVGDLAFQRKCINRMEELIKGESKTVLLVSHNIRQVERICGRAILLDHGRIAADGSPPTVCDEFYRRGERHGAMVAKRSKATSRQQSSGEINMLEVKVVDADGTEISELPLGGALTVCVKYDVRATLERPIFGVGIHTPDFLYLATTHSEAALDADQIEPGIYRLMFHIAAFPFLPGVYCVRIGIAVGGLYSTAFYAENVASFQVVAEDLRWAESLREGIVPLEGTWTIESVPGPPEGGLGSRDSVDVIKVSEAAG